MLPPDKARAALAAPAPRTSNVVITRCAWSRALRRRIQGPREKTLLRKRSDTAFSQTGRSPTTPTAWRSSGMRATPMATSCAGRPGIGSPSRRNWPLLAARVPHNNSAKVVWPLPETPAMATISPACNCSEACSSRSRPWPALTASSVQICSPTLQAGRARGGSTAWPTIHCASCSCVVVCRWRFGHQFAAAQDRDPVATHAALRPACG